MDDESPSSSPLSINEQLQSFVKNQISQSIDSSAPEQQQELQPSTSNQQQQLFVPQQILNDIKALFNGLQAAEERIAENERRIYDLEMSNVNLQNEIHTLTHLSVNNGNADNFNFSESSTFDPANIINDEDKYTVEVNYHNNETSPINIYEIAIKCKEFRISKKTELIGDLYKSIMKKIFGRDDIRFYTASDRRNRTATSCSNVVDVIKDFITTGYITNETSEVEMEFIKSNVHKIINKCNTYIFSNPRRNDPIKKRTNKQEPLSFIAEPQKKKNRFSVTE